jgi:uncharacterized membrane protein
MASSRKIIADFIGVFLIGALAGALITWSVSTWSADTQLTAVMSRWNNPDTLEARINAKYAHDYQLSPEEVRKIQPLVKQMALDIYKVRHNFGVDIISTLDNYHAQIAAQLTPEHRTAYEAKMAERKQQLTELLLNDQSSPIPEQK